MLRLRCFLLCLCLFLPMGAIAGSPEGVQTLDSADFRISFQIPGQWDYQHQAVDADCLSVALYDPQDITKAAFISIVPQDTPVSGVLEALRQEANALFEKGEGPGSQVLDQGVVNGLPLVVTKDPVGGNRICYLQDEGRYIILSYADPAASEEYGRIMDAVCQSIRVMDDMAPATYARGEFVFERWEEGVRILAYQGRELAVTVPDTLADLTVIAIGSRVFAGSPVERVELPDTVRVIGEQAFYGCASLNEIRLPQMLERIGKQAFESCVSLRRLELPDRVFEVAVGAFRGCKSVERLRLSRELEQVGVAAFGLMEGLKTIELPKESPYLKLVDGVLYTQSLEELVLYPAQKPEMAYAMPEGVMTIAPYAFSCAKNLKNLFLPQTLGVIGDLAFAENEKLEILHTPAGVKGFGDNLFMGGRRPTLYGVFGSDAQAYAKEKGLAFVAVRE